ncbi:MAG TPA: GDP-mannose 4,6-dehydratase [Longimicrobiaceae bacterium]|nr:GDP-mannose 4,6-dehydratase [Longimicrobiaceae bacterium]
MREREYTLITGGAGFVGCNLADALLSDGEPVVVADNLSRTGVQHNARWLKEKHGDWVRLERTDVRDAERMRVLVAGARRVYHLAAQVAVTTSLEDPVLDLQTNILGTFNVLEAARSMLNPPPILFTSTNKVYGGMEEVATELHGTAYRYADGRRGIDEAAPLDFHSPYGCSKGAADQYVRDYARIFGLPTVVFRMSCVYGTRQFGTEDQGWVAHFARSILGGEPITVYGDGFQVRDILWIEDLVRAIRAAMERIDAVSGEVFNLGGGAENAVSVRGVIERLCEITGREVPVVMADWRPGDQRVYVSDTTKAERTLEWTRTVGWEEGLERLVEWLREANLATPAFPLSASARVDARPAMVKVAP